MRATDRSLRPFCGKKILCWIVVGVMLLLCVGCKKKPQEEPSQPLDENALGLVIDIAEEASSKAHTFETIQDLMNGYAEQGLTQVWFRPIPDTYAATDSCQGSVVCDASIQSDHMHRTVHAVFDPNLAFMQAAKKAGMEINILYSPYEGGGSVSVPAGASTQFSFGSVIGIGGTSVFCSSGVSANKQQLISSLHFENPSIVNKGKPVTLEFAFAAEDFEDRISQSETKIFSPDASVEIVPQLWYSKNNIDYQLAKDVSFKTTTENRTLYDANGNALGEKACRVVKIDISDYSGNSYFAVALENGDKLYTVPFSMIELYDKNGTAITSTKAVYTRNPHSDALVDAKVVPNDYIWGAERMPIHVKNADSLSAFRAWGFEYQYGGCGTDWGDGWHNGYVYGIAVGSQKQMGGNLCEGFEAVREYWLGQVDRFYAKGADNVIICLENSGGMVYDYTNFGYNYFYVREFSNLYDIDILSEEFDYLQLMELRGSYFAEFLRAVDEVAEKNGKEWGIQLLSAFETPALDDDLNGLCHYKMPKLVFDWKPIVELCDSVLIYDYQYGGYQASVASQIRTYAAEHDKDVTIMGYATCGADATFVNAAMQDAANTCVVLDSAEIFFSVVKDK